MNLCTSNKFIRQILAKICKRGIGPLGIGATAMQMNRTQWTACLTLLVSLIGSLGTHADEKPSAAVHLFPFHDGSKWGYVNSRGEVVIEPTFREAHDFVDGRALVQTEKELAFIDDKGKIAFTMPDNLKPFDWMTSFAGGLARFSVKDKCGYFDRQGKVPVEPKYDDAGRFSEGLAAVNEGAKSAGFPRPFVREGGKWGFIDTTGRLVIPMRFSWVDFHGFSDGFALVSAGGTSFYIDKTGMTAITPEYKSNDPKRDVVSKSRFSEGLAAIGTGYKGPFTGFIDRTGKWEIEPKFHGAGDFSEGMVSVWNGKEHGYSDRTGRIVIKPQFDIAKDFSEGLAAVKKGEHWSFIDKQGKIVISGKFNDAENFKGGLARVHEGGEFERTLDGPAYWSKGTWYYINRKGEKVHRCRDDKDWRGPGFGMESK
jgi:hypothetical protein